MNNLSNQQPVYAFAPGSNHIKYIRPVVQSILKHRGNYEPQICILLPSKAENLTIDANTSIRIVAEKDLQKCAEHYCQESRADIGPFSAYAQLILPRYFKEYKKIVYLEVDQIIQRDVSCLYRNIWSRDTKLAAVSCEPPENFKANYPTRKYYNTGVFVYDTDFWIHNNLEDLCFRECKLQRDTNGASYSFYTQGAINNCLSDKIEELPPTYNLMNLGYVFDIPDSVIAQGHILHWNGSAKPWLVRNRYSKYYYMQHQCVFSDNNVENRFIRRLSSQLRNKGKSLLSYAERISRSTL